ncbi:winged helix-turn-helix domain-containing protein [Luteimonas sp. A478]
MAPLPSGTGDCRGQFRFDDVEVDAAAHSLRRGGVSQQLEPKSFGVLLALLQRPGQLVSHDDLLDQVWGHRSVTPGVLTRAIVRLRTALGDDSHHPRYIQTHHALGYAFIGTLEQELEPELELDGLPTPPPRRRRRRRRTDFPVPSPGTLVVLAVAGAALAVVSAVLVLWGIGSGGRRATDAGRRGRGVRAGEPAQREGPGKASGSKDPA